LFREHALAQGLARTPLLCFALGLRVDKETLVEDGSHMFDLRQLGRPASAAAANAAASPRRRGASDEQTRRGRFPMTGDSRYLRIEAGVMYAKLMPHAYLAMLAIDPYIFVDNGLMPIAATPRFIPLR